MMQRDAGRIRWGVLGCARVAAAAVVPGIRLSRNGVVAAVASRNIEKAKMFGDRFGIPSVYGRYEDLLDDPTIEAVYIPLPNSCHKEWTIRAALKGKHVLCEKPLACDARDALEMVNTCSNQGVLLMEAFAHRFHPHNVLAKSLIAEGKIGQVLGFTAIHSSGRPAANDVRLNKALGGGVLEDKGCYCINTARYVLGSEPVSVFASVKWGENSGVSERVTVLLEFPHQAQVHFDTSFRLDEGVYQQGYEVFGGRGRILVPEGFAQLPTYRRGEIVDTVIALTDNQAGSTEIIKVKGDHQWKLEVEYFAERVQNGENISFPAEDGLSNMIAMDAIYQSARDGRPVKIQGF